MARLRACLAEPPAESPSTMKSSAPCGRRLRAVGELAGQPELAHGRLAGDVALLAPPHALFGALDHPVEQLVGFGRRIGKEMVERVADGVLDDALGLGRRQLVLRLADEFGLPDEDGQHAGGRDHHVFGGDLRRALVAGQFAIGLQAARQRDAQAGFVRAALGRRNGVAVGTDEGVPAVPGHRPFERSVAAGLLRAAGEDFARHLIVLGKRLLEIVLETAGEMEDGAFRRVRAFAEERGVAAPADLDAAEQIRLRARHVEQAVRVEAVALAEDRLVRVEADLRPPPVLDVAGLLEPGQRQARGKTSAGRACGCARPRPRAGRTGR